MGKDGEFVTLCAPLVLKMKIDRTLIGALLIGILVLAPTASSISISVSCNTGGLTESIHAEDRDSVYGSVVIGSESLSNSIRGSGSLKERHWVSDSAGASAGVGVEIRKAESYEYGYSLTPGIGPFWPACRYPAVSASETLDVVNTNYIHAYANSFNAEGGAAGVSTILSDPGRKASLTGYTNSAAASSGEAFAFQDSESASAPNGSIQTEAYSQLNRLRIFPLELKMEKADASTAIKNGSVSGYSDQAEASNNKLEAWQHIDSASGKQIEIGSKSTYFSASFSSGLNKSTAKASTTIVGTLTEYDGIGKVSEGHMDVRQSGHIAGTFASSAVAGSASKTRSSSYDGEYDLNMQAKKDASGSSASGTLGYYVDSNDLIANKIQGAVDASESGDAINVASGTYNENVQIDKSLTIKGAGASNTIVNGHQSGSVFTVGKNDPKVNVSLSGMTVQGGTGTLYVNNLYPGIYGGGILNFGTIKLKDTTISGNTAAYGGGIANFGTANLEGCSITGNSAQSGKGGGIYSSWASDVIMNSGSVTGNTAELGGGIFNYGGVNLNGGSITGNSAHDGGGIYNSGRYVYDPYLEFGQFFYGGVNMAGGNITENRAISKGGGICNDYLGGNVNLDGGSITENIAPDGGGIYSIFRSVTGNLDLVKNNHPTNVVILDPYGSGV